MSNINIILKVLSFFPSIGRSKLIFSSNNKAFIN